MKRVLITSTAIALLAVASQAALAADMPARPLPPQGPVTAPPPAMFNWSGFYAGLHGGYGWGRSSFDSPISGSTGTFNANGWTFGGVAGVNYQAGATVFGVEADINWANFGGSTTCPGGGTVCETDMPWYGTVRGRLGYAVDRFMPYLTGGLAYGKVEANEVGVGSTSSTRVGWTVGAGAEYALTENVSWKTEYLYMDLGSFNCSACVDNDRVDFRSHVVRTGLNFRF